MHIRQY